MTKSRIAVFAIAALLATGIALEVSRKPVPVHTPVASPAVIAEPLQFAIPALIPPPASPVHSVTRSKPALVFPPPPPPATKPAESVTFPITQPDSGGIFTGSDPINPLIYH